MQEKSRAKRLAPLVERWKKVAAHVVVCPENEIDSAVHEFRAIQDAIEAELSDYYFDELFDELST